MFGMGSSRILKKPNHPSYKIHRRQRWTQILLPVLLAALVIFVAPVTAWLAGVGPRAEVGRWAAISTMWLLLPVVLVLLALLVVLVLIIFLAARLGTLAPPYTDHAQRIAAQAAEVSGRAAAMIHRPALVLRGLRDMAGARWRRLRGKA
jgi:uncharacterized membrane protein